MLVFDRVEPMDGMDGKRLYADGAWAGSVWHSNIWGWQWARLFQNGRPWIGGQCESFRDGERRIALIPA